MSSFATSMFSAMAAMASPQLPAVSVEKVFGLSQQQEMLFRTATLEQMFQSLIEWLEQDPAFWRNVDIAQLNEQLEQSRQLIRQTRPFTQDHRLIATFERLETKIKRVEQLHQQAFQFNFDLARMQDRVNDHFHQAPKTQSADEFRQWLKAVANGD